MSDPLAEVRALFDPAPGLVYLDSATYGLPPRPTVEAMHAAIDAWRAGSANWVRDWDTRGENCRAAFAALTSIPVECVALAPSVSVGVGTVVNTLTSMDEVVIADDEFTSVLFPILVAARERGVRVREVPFAALAESVAPTTTLVAFSLVQSHSGRTTPMEQIVAAARAAGARTLVDATHAVPFVPLSEGADFVVCAAYKHLLSPRGVAFLAVARERWDDMPPLFANWRSSTDPYSVYYGGPLDLAPNAARFDVSLAWFAWAGAAVSMELLAKWQRQGLLGEAVGLARRLAAQLGVPEPVGTIVSLAIDDAEGVRAELASAGIKGAVRAGAVRLSPHVYNTAEQVDRAAAALARFTLRAPSTSGRGPG